MNAYFIQSKRHASPSLRAKRSNPEGRAIFAPLASGMIMVAIPSLCLLLTGAANHRHCKAWHSVAFPAAVLDFRHARNDDVLAISSFSLLLR